MYRFPCFHAIRRPNISLTFIAVRSTNCGASSDHDVNNNIHKTQPRRSTLVRVALVLPPARILREYDPGTYRSRAAVASSLAPRDNFFSARHRLRFLSAPPCTVASRKPRDWNGGSDRPARATKESKTKTLEHEAQLARDTQPFRHASTLKGTHMHARVPIAYEMTRPRVRHLHPGYQTPHPHHATRGSPQRFQLNTYFDGVCRCSARRAPARCLMSRG